jgi:hypothetical protein
MVIRIAARLMITVLLWGFASAAQATGPNLPEIRFFSRSGQDPESDIPFFHGRLGILRPTMDDNRLYAAYRIMMGGGFTDAQAQQLLARCCGTSDADYAALTGWNDGRRQVLGPPAPERDLPVRNRPADIAVFDVSCFPNAYRTAAATLQARIAEHGVGDPWVREWVIGQDIVLRNCQANASVPQEIPNAPAWLKADRAYQIASTYFYQYDYARAGELFAEIGRDASSPWRKVARYLVARSAVHAAIADKTPDLMAAAQSAVAAITAESELKDYRDDAPRLAAMLAFGTRPQERAEEIEKTLLAADLPPTLAVDVRDLEWLERTGRRYTDLGAWLYDLDLLASEKGRKDATAKADVLRRWNDSKRLPWLVATLMWLAPGDPETTEAIAASREIAASSPAYYTLAWHRVRLLIGEDKREDARAELDRLLGAGALPAGVGNLLRYHRLKLARDLAEFEKFALRRGEFVMGIYDPHTKLDATALPLTSAKRDGFIAGIVDWRKEMFGRDPVYFDEDGTAAISLFMPLSMMAKVVLSESLPPHLKRDIALVVWTRAVVLDDTETAQSMAAVLAPFFPQFAEGWRAYRAAGTAESRKAEAALLMLRLPAARPWPDSGMGYLFRRDVIGRFGPRWWDHDDARIPDSLNDRGEPMLCSECALPLEWEVPAFITRADRDRAEKETARLREVPGGPTYLGAIVMAWAKAHPGDPRVPEALHLVVRATQYGEADSDTSKAAYLLLHNRFPRNPWTAKTPRWF